MAVANVGSKGFIVSSIKCLRNVNLFCNNKSGIFRQRCSLYSFSSIKFNDTYKYKTLKAVRCFSSIKVQPAQLKSSKLTFQQHLHFRKKQAECSVIVELNNKTCIPHATSTCQQFGIIKNVYSYNGISENVFLLLEFDNEDSVKKLLSHCYYENISDSFTTYSRIVHFENKSIRDSIPKISVEVKEDDFNPVLSKAKTISELIEDVYKTEKISELNTRLRYFFCLLVKDSLSGIFPNCEVFPFGSSVNGIGRHGCDLDCMLRLYPLQTNETFEFSFLNKTCVGNVQELQRKSLYVLGDFFRTFLPGFSSVKKILHARVPIVKLNHKVLGIECDLSVNNMSAILMSEMLYYCGEIDSRVRPLLYAVKKWAKEAKITYDAPGPWITNFGLSLLVVFFLQNRPVPILPCLNDSVEIIGAECMPNFHLEYLTPLTELQIKASLNTESLAELLREFLSFVGSYPFNDQHLSILTGLAIEKISEFPVWMQYPLEEDKNVTKNISQKELKEMCDKARVSSNCLADCMKRQLTYSNLSSILGIPIIIRSFSPRKTNLDDLLKNDKKRTWARGTFK